MNRILVFASSLLLIFSTGLVRAEDILSGLGGFEEPGVIARVPKAKGGDPSLSAEHGLFSSFSHKPGDKEGTLVAGLSSEASHSGAQSLYIEADHLSAQYEGAGIQTNPIPILPQNPYRITIWGKMDPKTPFLIKNRPVYIKLQVDFVGKDKETQAGETVYLVQPIPGTKNRDTFFNDKTWTEFGIDFTTPEAAVYAVVTWRWETAAEPGETSGVIYFDDLTIVGAMPPVPLIKTFKVAAEPANEEPAIVTEALSAESLKSNEHKK